MSKSKINKIDLNREYPCPCKRKGVILPIVLTEAMGCDLCQNIFVLTEDGEFIEEVSSSYTYKKKWFWNGKRWISRHSNRRKTNSYLSLSNLGMMIAGTVFFLFILKLVGNVNIIFWSIIIFFVVILSLILLWLTYRR